MELQCPGGHVLEEKLVTGGLFKSPKKCNRCKQDIPIGEMRHGCKCCHYYLCASCSLVVMQEQAQSEQREPKALPSGAAMATGAVVGAAATAASLCVGLACEAGKWGISAAADQAKKHKHLQPGGEAVVISDSTKENVAVVREATRGFVNFGTAATGALVDLAGKAANSASKYAGAQYAASKETSSDQGAEESTESSRAWMTDALHVGKASAKAAASVFLSVSDATNDLASKSADKASELVGQKYGDDAGSTMRDGMHVAGNVMDARNIVTKKALAKAIGKEVVVEGAQGFGAGCSASQAAVQPQG